MTSAQRRSLLQRLTLATVAALTLGCSDSARMESYKSVAMSPSEAYGHASPASAPTGLARAASPSESQGQATSETPPASTPSATTGRKIIYNAGVDLVTEDLNVLEAGLNRLVTAQKAYVADSDRSGSAGVSRHGSWKVRVPVENYDAFLRGAVGLGELVSIKADSQDVSEEFYDLDARQTAKKVEETRLLKHLSDSTGKLDEILAVERELSRVRIEIERMQGRLRAIANLTSLATVTITAREIKGYIPPQAPTFATRVSRTFAASMDSLLKFGEQAVLFVVAIAPWLPLLFVGAAIVWIVLRVIARRIRRAVAANT